MAGLDAMMNGGIPVGETAMIVGPSWSGKSTLARHFVAGGAAVGERSVIAVYEEHSGEYLARADSFGARLRSYRNDKQCLGAEGFPRLRSRSSGFANWVTIRTRRKGLVTYREK